MNAPELLERLTMHLGQLVLGKRAQTRLALTCLVARGHLLIEDIPGVGKTTLAEGLAKAFSLSFARVQFTSDVLPSDILGARVFVQQRGDFELKRGPVFHQLVLADELNRAPPRTQSALLEVMAQAQVSIDGTTHPVPKPFAVVATQNPIDLAGTYPLPDSQLDRFLMRLSLGHLTNEAEVKLLVGRRGDPLETFEPIGTAADLMALQAAADAVKVPQEVGEYLVRLASATRSHSEIERGASTRAMLSVTAAARAHALWEGRSFITPGDVRAVWAPSLAHRVILRASGAGTFSREEAAHLLGELAQQVPAPT